MFGLFLFAVLVCVFVAVVGCCALCVVVCCVWFVVDVVVVLLSYVCCCCCLLRVVVAACCYCSRCADVCCYVRCCLLRLFVVCRWLLLFAAGTVYGYRLLFVSVAACRRYRSLLVDIVCGCLVLCVVVYYRVYLFNDVAC